MICEDGGPVVWRRIVPQRLRIADLWSMQLLGEQEEKKEKRGEGSLGSTSS